MMKVFYPVTEVPAKGAGRKKNTKEVDMVDKMFSEIARNTQIVTVVTQESLRSDSVKAMQQWKFLSSLYNLLLTDLKDICRNADVLFNIPKLEKCINGGFSTINYIKIS